MRFDFPRMFEFGVIVQCGNSFFRARETIDATFNFNLRMAVKVFATRKTMVTSHNILIALF